MNRVIAGNWKMNKTRREAVSLIEEILEGSGTLPDDVELRVFPPATALASVAEFCHGSRIQVGGQNFHPELSGAFTGEVSARMLLEAGAESVLIGHSERRALFGETDEWLATKARAALEQGLAPVFCVGEQLEERERGETESVIQRQLETGLASLSADELRTLQVAYEPVWAIGTGRTATPDQVRDAHQFLRRLLVDRWSETGQTVPLLYGGSVKPANAAELMGQPDVNGVLVGGASLEAAQFLGIASAR